MNTSETTIVTAMGVTGLCVVTGSIATGHRPHFRPVAGVAVAGFLLLAAAQSDSLAKIAAQLAALIAVTALLTSGYYAAAGIARYFSTKGNP